MGLEGSVCSVGGKGRNGRASSAGALPRSCRAPLAISEGPYRFPVTDPFVPFFILNPTCAQSDLRASCVVCESKRAISPCCNQIPSTFTWIFFGFSRLNLNFGLSRVNAIQHWMGGGELFGDDAISRSIDFPQIIGGAILLYMSKEPPRMAAARKLQRA